MSRRDAFMNISKISHPILLILFALVLPSAILAAPGDIDLSFGQDGITLTSFGNSSDAASAVSIQTDGKIVVVGSTFESIGEPVSRAAIARYNPDGTLDFSFAVGGKAFHRLGIKNSYSSVFIQPDGKILYGCRRVRG